jgi:cell division septal protein FtsQ
MKPTVEMQRGFPYRRRMFAARHRRRSLWSRLARPFLGAVLLVGSPAALTAWVMTSPEFTVREIAITGGERVTDAWVREALAGIEGTSMFEVAAVEIERRLAGHPWLAAVNVRKSLPDRVHVELFERRPAALYKQDGALQFVDTNGEVFTAFDPAAGPADLLVLSGLSSPTALETAMNAARRLRAVEPEWGASLSEVEVLSETDLRLHTSALPFPLVVSAEGLEEAIENLRAELPEMHPHLEAVGAIDLRFERYIVIQPVKER